MRSSGIGGVRCEHLALFVAYYSSVDFRRGSLQRAARAAHLLIASGRRAVGCRLSGCRLSAEWSWAPYLPVCELPFKMN